jgi:hypothetical protein
LRGGRFFRRRHTTAGRGSLFCGTARRQRFYRLRTTATSAMCGATLLVRRSARTQRRDETRHGEHRNQQSRHTLDFIKPTHE